MTNDDIAPLFKKFKDSYDVEAKDHIWNGLSLQFHTFWTEKILSGPPGPIPDDECDKIIRILDRNGKGNTKDSESVAKAMIAQGAWRRMFNELHDDCDLSGLLTKAFEEQDAAKKAQLIDQLYLKNEGNKNNLTGQAANAVNAFLAAYDPVRNLTMISLNDRLLLIRAMGWKTPFDWDKVTIGERIVNSNIFIREQFRSAGVTASARTICSFSYSRLFKPHGTPETTVKRSTGTVPVTIPVEHMSEEGSRHDDSHPRESIQMQALLAKMGAQMGFKIWLPRADRGRVTQLWQPAGEVLLESLPLSYDNTTLKTIEQIDVLWLEGRMITRAFEVEHTTSIYSGILRMADLMALQPNMDIKLHIVAPADRRDKVLEEIGRPIFTMLQRKPLSEMCTFLSYDNLRELAASKLLRHLSPEVLQDYEERAEP